jgi:hypothetical protein
VKSWIDGALFHLKQFVGCSLNMESNPVTVQFASLRECFENEEVKATLEIVSRHSLSPILLSIAEGIPRSVGKSTKVESSAFKPWGD